MPFLLEPAGVFLAGDFSAGQVAQGLAFLLVSQTPVVPGAVGCNRMPAVVVCCEDTSRSLGGSGNSSSLPLTA
jgi:hypothetical protein